MVFAEKDAAARETPEGRLIRISGGLADAVLLANATHQVGIAAA
jgi:hypothetical protein